MCVLLPQPQVMINSPCKFPKTQQCDISDVGVKPVHQNYLDLALVGDGLVWDLFKKRSKRTNFGLVLKFLGKKNWTQKIYLRKEFLNLFFPPPFLILIFSQLCLANFFCKDAIFKKNIRQKSISLKRFFLKTFAHPWGLLSRVSWVIENY